MKGKNELCVRYPDIAVRERDTRALKTAEKAVKTGWHGFCYNVSRMKNAKQRNGSVLMEYVIVLVFIGATLALSSAQLFYRDGRVAEADKVEYRADPPGFGELGKRFVGFYQRTMGGLSLPVP